jgi:tRNA(fMet)-specific endonuclease VapC
MLDTNIASDLIRSSRWDDQILRHSKSCLAVSSITEAELSYGISKKPEATKLRAAVRAFLQTVEICHFDSNAANSYGDLRAKYESEGLGIGGLDGLIAGHALSLGLTLVTIDRVLMKLSPWLNVEEW